MTTVQYVFNFLSHMQNFLICGNMYCSNIERRKWATDRTCHWA